MAKRSRPNTAWGPDTVTGLAALAVSGFKSIVREQRIEFRPLTILAGANSSGKSSMMQPLLLLKQTLDAPYDPGPLLLLGPHVQFTSADQILSRTRPEKTANHFCVQLELDYSGGNVGLEFKNVTGHALTIDGVTWQVGSKKIRMSPDMRPDQIVAAVRDLGQDPQYRETLGDSRWEVVRQRFFLFFCLTLGKPGKGRMILDTFSMVPPIGPYIQKIIHVPNQRGNPARAYNRAAVGSAYEGTFDKYAASLVYHWQVSDKEHLTQLNQSLEDLGMTWKIEARRLNDAQVELWVGRLPHCRKGHARDLVNIADVGFGVSQVLPVVVALLAATKDQMVYIEEPEIHLHPRAQVRLARLLCDAAKKGVQVVVETHSALLLEGIQTAVAEGYIRPELVKLHWFTRREDGTTDVASADLDESGAYGDWPQDFGEVSLKADSRYLDAAEARLSMSLHAK